MIPEAPPLPHDISIPHQSPECTPGRPHLGSALMRHRPRIDSRSIPYGREIDRPEVDTTLSLERLRIDPRSVSDRVQIDTRSSPDLHHINITATPDLNRPLVDPSRFSGRLRPTRMRAPENGRLCFGVGAILNLPAGSAPETRAIADIRDSERPSSSDVPAESSCPRRGGGRLRWLSWQVSLSPS